MSHLSLKALQRIENNNQSETRGTVVKNVFSCLCSFNDAKGKVNLFRNFGVSIQYLAERIKAMDNKSQIYREAKIYKNLTEVRSTLLIYNSNNHVGPG